MVFFVVPFRVPLLLWTLLIASTSSDKIKGNSTDTSLITNFLRKIVIPYLESDQLLNGKRRENPADNKILTTQIENAIRQKVIKLKPMLQHREHNDNINIKPKTNLKLDENDKTTTVGLVSDNNRKSFLKSSLKDTQQKTYTSINNIEKYKHIRQHITFLLHKEKTSSSTSKLITRTLNDMLALLMEGDSCQCKNLKTADVINYLLKDTRTSDGQYKLMCYMQPGKPDIQIFTGPGHPEHIPHMKSSDKTVARENKIKDKYLCDTFIVCSEELTEFLRMTYHHLNETAVSIFTNYAAMYIRDVKEETKSVKDDVSSELEYLSNSAEKRVHQIFLQELKHFTLDENKHKAENIRHIKHFIKATTAHIKSSIHRLVGDELSAMKNKLFLTMKDDLTVNLRMDIDNLSRLLETKICGSFILCNDTLRRAKISNKHRTLRPKHAENIYGKEQHSFYDENSLAHFGHQYLNSWQEQTFRSHAIKPNKYSYVNVTRSTVRSTATMEDTFSSEIGSTDKFFK